MTVLVVLLALVGIAQGLPQCRDEDNNPVDWYVLYKLPRNKESSSTLIQNGVAYAYITSDSVSRGWILSNSSINDTKSMPGNTLELLYNSSDVFKANSLLWALYNDQVPGKTYSSDQGHTKGVVISETDGGFWLVHSVPYFPPIPGNVTTSGTDSDSGGYSYPSTGLRYGQSFLCISLSASQLDLVGTQLTYNQPWIYSYNVPEDLERHLPHLAAAARSVRVRVAPWHHLQEITSLAGQAFYSFAKAVKFNKELYFDWVAPALQTDLLVETWRNGKGKLPSSCNSTFTVQDISSVTVDAANIRFKSTEDHSKWAAAYEDDNTENDWVCIGDINRMESQERRGGGTVCINHPKLWQKYWNIVSSIDPCPANQ
ncbi:Deoxyribonuclease-2-alpha [Cryptotermes secundus]|uniref:Deoxyribonuclease-2-alpha n=1 Tax=Cryptotermes secundus TaxID=105785 RepID=A0A2J7QXD5_9NEOP|nr:deoxyribonuclease-2-alpha [Cryptotermes secundus]PNF33238.1 Deoxyribonuclease-2-alpha [Cryptotermes secundus]